MNNDTTSDDKQVITTKRPTQQRINYYAALAIALIMAVILPILVFAGTAISESGNLSTDMMNYLGLSSGVLIIVFALGLPPLVIGKYGWRTVLTSILLEVLLLFVATSGIALFVGQTNNQPTPYDCMSCGLEN